MNRIPRTAAAVALSAALLVAAAPAVQARSIDRHSSVQPAAGWFDAALAWLTNALAGTPQAPAARSPQTKTTTPTPIGSPGHGAVPMTGSCIDPNGCLTSGGRG